MMRSCIASASLLALLVALLPEARGQGREEVVVPAGGAPLLDGRVDGAEWEGAAGFDLRRGDDVHGRVLLRRHGRQMHVAYRSEHGAFAFGLRLRVTDPATGRTVVAMVTPLHPPLSPMSGLLERPSQRAERIDMSTCDLRMSLRGEEGFSFEARIPLDLLELERSAKSYEFSAEALNLLGQDLMAVFPHAAEGILSGQGVALLRPQDHWGTDVPAGAQPAQPALLLLHQLESEQMPPAAGEEAPPDDLMMGNTGVRDGKRRQAPLEALEGRVRALIGDYPDYVSLRANLVRVLSNLNRPADALTVLDAIRRDFPEVMMNEREVLVRMQLQRDQGLYHEALETLQKWAQQFGASETVSRQMLVAKVLEENWLLEEQIRKEEARRDDLPRVLFKTTKGEITIELFEDDAPNGVANFLELCASKAYDGTRFHWLISGRWVFGGDPNSRDEDENNDGFGDPGYLVEPEPSRRLNFPMTIAYTEKRRSRRSEGCAFAINLTPAPERDGHCTVLGRVIQGEEVVRRLEYYDTLERATVLRKRDHPYPVAKRLSAP